MIKYMTRDGKTEITLIVVEQYGALVVKAEVGGKVVGHESWESLIAGRTRCGLPEGCVASVGKVALTSERFAELTAIVQPLQDEMESRPEVRMERKIQERTRLYQERSYAVQAMAETHERMIEQLSANGVSRLSMTRVDADFDLAAKACDAFDDAHPDVVREVAKRRAAAHDEWMAQGN